MPDASEVEKLPHVHNYILTKACMLEKGLLLKNLN